MKVVLSSFVLALLANVSVVNAFQVGGSPKALKPAADISSSPADSSKDGKNTALSIASTGEYLDTIEQVGRLNRERTMNSYGRASEPKKAWYDQPNRYGYSYAAPWYESQRRRPYRYGAYGTQYASSAPSYSSYSSPWYQNASNRPWYDRPTNRNGYTANRGSLTRVVRWRDELLQLFTLKRRTMECLWWRSKWLGRHEGKPDDSIVQVSALHNGR